MPKSGDGKAPWQRLTGLGFELFGAVLGFSLLGFWIDWHFDTRPWGLLICVILGLVGGLYNLIRTSLSALNPTPRSGGSRREDRDSGDDWKR